MRVEWSLDIGAPSPRLSSTEIVHDQDLARLLDDIERDAPERVIAEIVAPDGARLGIGLGGTRSVLVFNPSPQPPYFMSRGDTASTDEGPVFYLHGHWTEFPASALVPRAEAREAARRFVQTGDRPDNVSWQEV